MGEWAEDEAEYFPTPEEMIAEMVQAEVENGLDDCAPGWRRGDRGLGRVRPRGSRPASFLGRPRRPRYTDVE
jgi:hypothetical protein